MVEKLLGPPPGRVVMTKSSYVTDSPHSWRPTNTSLSSMRPATSTKRVLKRISQKRKLSTTCARRSHYETLGLPQDASKAQIKSSFYRLSKQHHPDLSKDPKSPDNFRKVNEAYQILSNDRERRAYDRSLLHRGPPSDPFGRYTPHAPTSKDPKATYAWKYSYTARTARGTYTGTASSNPFRRTKEPPPDYFHASRPRRPGPNPQHDHLKGSRKRTEDFYKEADRLRNESVLIRTLQLCGVIAIPVLLMGGFGMPGF